MTVILQDLSNIFSGEDLYLVGDFETPSLNIDEVFTLGTGFSPIHYNGLTFYTSDPIIKFWPTVKSFLEAQDTRVFVPESTKILSNELDSKICYKPIPFWIWPEADQEEWIRFPKSNECVGGSSLLELVVGISHRLGFKRIIEWGYYPEGYYFNPLNNSFRDIPERDRKLRLRDWEIGEKMSNRLGIELQRGSYI